MKQNENQKIQNNGTLNLSTQVQFQFQHTPWLGTLRTDALQQQQQMALPAASKILPQQLQRPVLPTTHRHM